MGISLTPPDPWAAFYDMFRNPDGSQRYAAPKPPPLPAATPFLEPAYTLDQVYGGIVPPPFPASVEQRITARNRSPTDPRLPSLPGLPGDGSAPPLSTAAGPNVGREIDQTTLGYGPPVTSPAVAAIASVAPPLPTPPTNLSALLPHIGSLGLRPLPSIDPTFNPDAILAQSEANAKDGLGQVVKGRNGFEYRRVPKPDGSLGWENVNRPRMQPITANIGMLDMIKGVNSNPLLRAFMPAPAQSGEWWRYATGQTPTQEDRATANVARSLV